MPGRPRHHAVRLEFKDGADRMEFSRLDFTRIILFKRLGFSVNHLNAVFALPNKQGFDVSFRAATILRSFWRKLDEDPTLKETIELAFKVVKLNDDSKKTAFIRMFNETVNPEDIYTWLNRHCTCNGEPSKVVDKDGVWTGCWNVPIQLHPDEQGFEGLRQLPSIIVLGEDRGFVHYAGQPKLCRRCGESGHLVDTCKAKFCGKCRQVGHEFAGCPNGRPCNLCGEAGHLFIRCPQSFANKLKASRTKPLARAANPPAVRNRELGVGEGKEKKAGRGGADGRGR